MDSIIQGNIKSLINNHTPSENDILRIVITDGTTETALTFAYRIFSDNVFGENQLIFITFFEFQTNAPFLKSVLIELTSLSPNLLYGKHVFHLLYLNCQPDYVFFFGVSYSHDASIAFKDADVVICIGKARGYYFSEAEYHDAFFQKYVLDAKFYGEAIEKYAKRNVKVMVVGHISATVIYKFAKSIPHQNITSTSTLNLTIAAAHIAARAKCLPTEVKNLIVWGNSNKYVFPDCRYMYFANGKTVTDSLVVWLKNSLPHIMQNIPNRPSYIRSMAYALAQHCKTVWNGTPENEWTCMGVLSDHSYGIRAGIFFSYPVFCKNRGYEIVQDLFIDKYVEKNLQCLTSMVAKDIYAAFQTCGLFPLNDF